MWRDYWLCWRVVMPKFCGASGQNASRLPTAMFFERAGHLHTLLAALDEATIGQPLALLPVELRNFVGIFTRAMPTHTRCFAYATACSPAGFVGGGKPDDWQAVENFLTRCYGATDDAARAGEAVVDELRIVAGWLQRTRARARWVHLDVPMNATAALEAVMGALPSAGSQHGNACLPVVPVNRCHILMHPLLGSSQPPAPQHQCHTGKEQDAGHHISQELRPHQNRQGYQGQGNARSHQQPPDAPVPLLVNC